MKRILVIGSYNIGLTVIGSHIPREGETVMGRQFDMGPGGKGSNQAIAIARLGGNVRFLAQVGDDIFGSAALDLFRREGIDTTSISVDPQAHTGAGIIFVDDAGRNAIGVAPGANYTVTEDWLAQRAEDFAWADVLLIQLETPLPVVCTALRQAKAHGLLTILNPAPAQEIDPESYAHTDIITPNETEAGILSGRTIGTMADALAAGREFLARGVGTAIITLGAEGAVIVGCEYETHVPACQVQAVDTTGAGDAFNGGLAFALAAGMPLDEAVAFGCKVGALSVTAVGAVPGLPTLAAVQASFPADAPR